jgi:hypothetical protein
VQRVAHLLGEVDDRVAAEDRLERGRRDAYPQQVADVEAHHPLHEPNRRATSSIVISWTAPMGGAYSSTPSEKTTSCCEVVSDCVGSSV